MTTAVRDADRAQSHQGRYAGAVTRLLAYLAARADRDVPRSEVLTEVWSLDPRILTRAAGDAVDAVLASAAIPAVFPPVRIDGRDYVDGGVVNNTPISHAVALGAEVVWVLSTGYACALREPPRGALGMALHALTLTVNQRLAVDVLLQQPFAHHQRQRALGAPPGRIGRLVDDVPQIVEAAGVGRLAGGEPRLARLPALPGPRGEAQDLDLDAAALERARQDVGAAGCDHDGTTAHGARIVEQQRDDGVLEVGVLFALER